MITLELAPGHLPPGERIYAIGDVHGCADRLRRMHGLIRADMAARPAADVTVVHLGDLIDRGPDSAGALQLLIDPWPEPRPNRIVNLMGNHEELALNALDGGDPENRSNWLSNGGGETLRSWGVSAVAGADEWRAAAPPAQVGLLKSLALMHRAGGYAFVHAGVRPGVPLEKQSREDLLWIRDPFLRFNGVLPAVIVHGHTPKKGPEIRACRIGVDTGAFMGGPLTGAVLEGNMVGFLRA